MIRPDYKNAALVTERIDAQFIWPANDLNVSDNSDLETAYPQLSGATLEDGPIISDSMVYKRDYGLEDNRAWAYGKAFKWIPAQGGYTRPPIHVSMQMSVLAQATSIHDQSITLSPFIGYCSSATPSDTRTSRQNEITRPQYLPGTMRTDWHGSMQASFNGWIHNVHDNQISTVSIDSGFWVIGFQIINVSGSERTVKFMRSDIVAYIASEQVSAYDPAR